jgi:hypothetical protein
MSIEQQPAKALKRDQARELFELLIALDHNLIDLKFAMEKAWSSEDYIQVHAHLFSAQGTLNRACQLFAPEKTTHSCDQ